MWPLAPTQGGPTTSVGPTGSQVFTEHCSAHHGAPSPLFCFFLVFSYMGRGKGGGEDKKASEKNV